MCIVLCFAHAHNNFALGCYCDSRFIRSNFPKLHPALFFGTNLPGKQFRGRTQTGIVFRARCAGERARRAIKIHYRHARVPAARTFPFVFLTLTLLYTPSPLAARCALYLISPEDATGYFVRALLFHACRRNRKTFCFRSQ